MGRSLEHLRTAALLTAGAVAVGVLALAAASGDDSSAISPDTVDALAFDDRALAFTGAPDAVTVGRPAAEPTEASAVAQAATFDPGSPASPADPATDPAREGAPALPVNGPVDEGSTPTDAPATTAAISGATSSTSGTKPAPTSTTTARTSSTATPTTATPTTAPATTATPTTATPTTAPATSPLRVVMLEGESTSDPNGGWNTFPPGVAARLPDGTTLRVDGTNGYRIDNVLAEGSKASYLSAGTDVAVLWIGINDISQGRQPATVYAQMSQWVEARRNEGWERVIMVTVTKFEHPESVKSYSWGSHEVADQKRQELNSLIVANAAGADRVVDLRGVPGIGDAFSVHDTYWRADRVHFTGAGNEAVAEEVAAAILTLVR